MKRSVIAMIALIVGVFLLGETARSAVPRYISYQGYLAQSGTAATGIKSITFTLFDALTGGAQLCTSGAQAITVTNGLFSHNIGSVGCDLTTIDFRNSVYLEINVEGTTFSPRELITGAAYSLNTLAANTVVTPAGNIASTNAQAAIQELDTEKVSKAGDTMTGALTATAFIGDGSALINLPAAGGAVARIGDTMTGALGIGTSGATASLTVTQEGATDEAGYFRITDAGNGANALSVRTDGTGNAGNFVSSGGGIAVFGRQTGNGYGGYFTVSSGTGNAVYGETYDSGDVIYGSSSGTGGRGGYFIINDATNPYPALQAETHGAGYGFLVQQVGTNKGGVFNIINPANTDDAAYSQTTGTGSLFGGDHTGAGGNLIRLKSGGVDKFVVDKNGTITTGGAADNTKVLKVGDTMTGALAVNDTSAGNSVGVTQSGTGRAGNFQISNALNAQPSIFSTTNGTGRTGDFEISNAANSEPSVFAYTAGTGAAMEADNVGTGRAGTFYISNALNAQDAINTLTQGTGRAGYFRISNAANGSDALSGETNGSGNSVYGYTVGTGRAGSFRIDNVANSDAAVFGRTNGTGEAVSGYNSGSGASVYGINLGTGKAGYFEISNAANNSDAVTGSTDGAGHAVFGAAYGTGKAGYFSIMNAANSDVAVEGTTNGTGISGLFTISNAANASDALVGATMGTGRAGYFWVNNAANGSDALNSVTIGSGNSVYGYTVGTGSAGKFEISNAASFADSLTGQTNGNGNAVYGTVTGGGVAGFFNVNNPASTNIALWGVTNGSGPAVKGTANGTGRAGYFFVNNAASVADGVYVDYIGLGFPINFSNGAHLTNGGTWTNGSSRTYKKDIRPINDSERKAFLDKINNIQIVRFRYKTPGEHKLHVGMIAEDAPAEIAAEDHKGIETADADGLIIAALQAQQEEIEALKKEIKELKEK